MPHARGVRLAADRLSKHFGRRGRRSGRAADAVRTGRDRHAASHDFYAGPNAAPRALTARGGTGNARLLRRIAVVSSATTALTGTISAEVIGIRKTGFAYWIFNAPNSPLSLASSAAVAPAAGGRLH